MSKLLSDEELRAEILVEFKQVLRIAPEDYTENCTNVVMSIINTQKRLYAEMVVGGYPKNADRKNISDVMAEQRARIE